SVPTARFVVFEVHLADVRGEPLPKQIDQHDDVSLLDDLGLLRSLATEQHIHWHGPLGERGKIDVLQGKIALELFDQAALFVEPGVEIARYAHPLVRLLRFQPEPARKRSPLRWTAF